MAQIPDAPFVKILLAMKPVIAAPDYQDLAGTEAPITVRHSRSRKPVKSELPAVTIIFVSDTPQDGESGHSQDEIVRTMKVDLQVDTGLATENSEEDPTGLGLLARIAAVAVAALRAPDGTFIPESCDWAVEEEIEPDERSTPDEGRLVRALTVVYRTGAFDGNVLLASGENL